MKADMIHEKGSGRINEDAVSLSDDLFGVFDGATSLTRTKYEDGKTGGFLASCIARDTFIQNNGALTDLARKANTAIYEKMMEHGVNVADKASLWSTSCAVVRINQNHIEWVQTGDSLLLIIYQDGTYHLPITDFDHDRETLSMWKRLAPLAGEKNIYEILKDKIRETRAGMNVDYGVLNGEESFERFLNTGKTQKEGVKHILLFTDGLFPPSEDPERGPNFDAFVQIFLEGGLKALRDHVRDVEMTDLSCKTFPRFKPHDDIAAVAISF